MEKSHKVAALYIASLKALSLVHVHNHWTTRGASFYGDHLLFERLYKNILEDLDLAAEKFMGLFGDECLNYDLQTELLSKVLSKYKNLEGSPLEMSLSALKDCIKLCRDAYNCFEEEGKLTLGLDDMLMSIASNLEEGVYLLQQALNESPEESNE